MDFSDLDGRGESFMYYDDEYDEYPIDGVGFERPGSALRRATKGNPRIYACPTCKKPNMLTHLDVARHYQCDECADRAERGVDGY